MSKPRASNRWFLCAQKNIFAPNSPVLPDPGTLPEPGYWTEAHGSHLPEREAPQDEIVGGILLGQNTLE